MFIAWQISTACAATAGAPVPAVAAAVQNLLPKSLRLKASSTILSQGTSHRSQESD